MDIIENVLKLKSELVRYGLHIQIDGTTVSFSQVPACFLTREANEVCIIRIFDFSKLQFL